MGNQIDQGLTLQGMNSTLGEYMYQWLKSATPGLRPNTVANYAGYIRRHIVPALGDIKVAELRPDQVQQLYNEKAREGYSQNTIRMIHAVLHRALNQAARWGIIMRNPASVVNKPKPRRQEMKVWNETEVASFLSFFTGTRFDALFYLAVTTGMRKGELLGLKWTDLDWGNRELNIQQQLVRVTGKGRVFQEPKTAAGRRVVVLGDEVIARLRKHQIIQDQLCRFAGDRWQEHGVIFPTTIGTPENPDNNYTIRKSKKGSVYELFNLFIPSFTVLWSMQSN
jgi:integrase